MKLHNIKQVLREEADGKSASGHSAARPRLRIRKPLLIAAGALFLALGIVGAFLPVLPTTPFLLLSAACFLRSSKSLYIFLIRNKVFGPYIRNYIRYKAVTLRSKIMSIALLWAVLGASAVFFTSRLWLRILLGAVGAGVTAHLVLLKTLRADTIKPSGKGGAPPAKAEERRSRV